MLTDYTDYDTVRALLGVGPREVKDATLALPQYENQFILDLEDIDGGVGAAKTEYARIAAINPSSNRTASEARYYMLVNMFAGYSVAKQLLTTAPMFAPKQIGDGRAQVTRIEDPFEVQRTGVMAGFADLRSRISTLLLTLVPLAGVTTIPDRIFISSTGTTPDPITGV